MGEHVFTLDKEKSRYLETSHGRIHYKKHKGKTDWVVFIHGAGSNHSTWKPYLTEDISWIAFDLPGHGRSSRSNIFLDHMLEDLRRLIQKETTGKIILVGNSFGCIVAEKYYYRYPDDLVKLILMSPYSRNFSHFSFLFHSLSHVLYFLLRGKTTHRKLRFTDYWKYRDRPLWYYPYLDLRGTSFTNILNTLRILFGEDINLKDIKIPTWIFIGKSDFYCKKHKIRYETATNKNIKLHLINSHHLLMTRAPDEIIGIINKVIE